MVWNSLGIPVPELNWINRLGGDSGTNALALSGYPSFAGMVILRSIIGWQEFQRDNLTIYFNMERMQIQLSKKAITLAHHIKIFARVKPIL